MTTLTEQTIPDDKVEVLADGTIQVREATVILRDGVRDTTIPPRYSRYVLTPGADLTGKSDKITAVANAVWTSDVIAAWQAAQSAS